MRQKAYNFLVNKHRGISYRYHKMHDGSTRGKKYLSWLYLIWLNFAYYVLFCHSLDGVPGLEYYELKNINCKESESVAYLQENENLRVDRYIEKLKKYEIISFDIFDTLIFRPFAQPTDLFYLIGEKLGIVDFKNIRQWAEWSARMKCHLKNKHMEVNLYDIWKEVENDVGSMAKDGAKLEIDTELLLCYANPFMLQVWNELKKRDIPIIVVSDMYLPKSVIEEMLYKNGYTGYDKLYVSCEYGKNKASGTLFEVVKKDYPNKKIIHVGDNPHSDKVMAQKNGFATCQYPNVNKNMLLYRPFDMSYLVGSAYRALISNKMYNGTESKSMEYEYGYIYGGLFVLGYCDFIHTYCIQNKVDILLFLSRDGDILKQIYDVMYPEDVTKYVYWSRKAATIQMADEDKHDYFRRFLYHKINQGYTLADILKSMQLDFLAEELKEWKEIWLKKDDIDHNVAFIDLRPGDEITDKNAHLLRCFIEAKWDKVINVYSSQNVAAKKYYSEILNGTHKAVAVDIGWAGSGAMALSHLVEDVWKIPCTLTGLIAGTNTIYNAEPDASEPFLQSGKLVAYLYSQSHNRDLLKKHDLNKDYNVFWELLLSSPTPQFSGFKLGNVARKDSDDVYLKDIDVTLQYGKYDANQEGIKAVQSGIKDFVSDYMGHFKDFPFMLHVSGRDAYAPMLVASGNNEKYLKAIEKKFDLEINVN